MEGSISTKRPIRHRTVVVGTAAAAAAVLLLGSAAWACTQRVGTLTVCRPPASTYVSTAQCGKITSTAQTGTPTLYKGGSKISVKAASFYNKPYGVTFRRPGSGASCFIPTADQVFVLTSAAPSLAGSAPAGQTQFMGPSFQAEFQTPAVTSTGQARVCSQDIPDRVTGQVINFTVI
jgi:hypothetical protein